VEELASLFMRRRAETLLRTDFAGAVRGPLGPAGEGVLVVVVVEVGLLLLLLLLLLPVGMLSGRTVWKAGACGGELLWGIVGRKGSGDLRRIRVGEPVLVTRRGRGAVVCVAVGGFHSGSW